MIGLVFIDQNIEETSLAIRFDEQKIDLKVDQNLETEVQSLQ